MTEHSSTTTSRRHRFGAAGLVALSALTSLPVFAGAATSGPAPAADAAVVCSRWAADGAHGGSWTGDGTQANPVRTLQALTDLLAPGQVGCVKNGSALDWRDQYGYVGTGVIRKGGIAGSPVTVLAEPGGTASFAGEMRVNPDVHDVVIRDLRFTGAPDHPKGTSLQIQGDRIELRNNDIANPYGICINLGSMSAYTNVDNGDPSDDVVIDGNRIHDCGNSTTLTWSASDSGSHGVYLVYSHRAQVTNNLIYDNGWRGLQTWPRADGTLIANNLFDGNASHVNIGSALTDGYPWYSSNTTVRDNIMSNRRTDFQPSKNPASIYGNFPNGSPTYGNQAAGNCIDPAGTPTAGNGIAFGANTLAAPVYVNRAAKDFRLAAGSPCIGKGPASIQPAPTGAPAFTASFVSGAATATPGDVVAHTWRITNTGTASGSASFFWAGGGQGTAGIAATVYTGARITGGTCTANACTTAVLAPGASATITIKVAVGKVNQSFQTAIGGGDFADAAKAIAVSGTDCTKVGTAGADSLVGTSGADVLCGFEGNDWFYPGAGNDVVRGGAGTDTVAYSNAAAATVVNLGQAAAWDRGATTAIGWDTFTGIEAAYGSNYDDLLVGSPGADTLSGGYGNDELWGYDGNDALYGNAGTDTLNGGNGTDTCSDLTDLRNACEA